MKVPVGIAAVVIAAQSGSRDPLDEAYRAAMSVFDLPVSRAAVAVSPDGLYPQGQVSCEFLLTPVTNHAPDYRWRNRLDAGQRPCPRATRRHPAISSSLHPLPQPTPAVGYKLPPPEPGR